MRASSQFYFYLVRVERIELSSQVWKTCILTTVLYPHFVSTIYELKFWRLVVSRSEARLLIERRAKTAEIQNFKRKFGVGYRDRTDDLLDHNQTL